MINLSNTKTVTIVRITRHVLTFGKLTASKVILDACLG